MAILLPTLLCNTRASWQTWLGKHHAESPGVWLQLAKKDSGQRSVSYVEALEVALCYGWIDGQKRSLDESYWLQKFTPRRPGSVWSEINRQRVEDLIARGQMQPAGRAAIEHAKANGRWEAAYGRESHVALLPELEVALREHPKAAAFFRTLNSANRYAILFRLQTAKKPETRARRLAQFVAMLERGETLY